MQQKEKNDNKEEATITSKENEEQSKIVPSTETMSLGGEAKQVFTHAGVTTKDDDENTKVAVAAGEDDFAAVDDVAGFQDEIVTGLEVYDQTLKDHNKRT